MWQSTPTQGDASIKLELVWIGAAVAEIWLPQNQDRRMDAQTDAGYFIVPLPGSLNRQGTKKSAICPTRSIVSSNLTWLLHVQHAGLFHVEMFTEVCTCWNSRHAQKQIYSPVRHVTDPALWLEYKCKKFKMHSDLLCHWPSDIVRSLKKMSWAPVLLLGHFSEEYPIVLHVVHSVIVQ